MQRTGKCMRRKHAEAQKACAEDRRVCEGECEEERRAHNKLLEETHCVNEQQERMNRALLDIL